MEVKCYCSGHEVLASGMLFTFEHDGNARLDLKFDGSFQFPLEFRFRTTEDGAVGCRTDVEDGALVFTCTNFVHTPGSGTTVPVEIATYNGKKVFIIFWVDCTGVNSPRKIEYNIYLE